MFAAIQLALLPLTTHAQPTALVAHFPLDEGQGAIARDVGPNVAQGEVHGATWMRYGKGHVLSFDGEDDYVRCQSPALDLRGSLTLSAWVWPEDTPTGEVGIAGKQFSSYLLTYYIDRKAWWYIGAGTNHTTAQAMPGTWSHLAGTFDGTKLRLYVNGELIDEKESTFRATPPGGAFFIGCVVGDPTAADPAYSKSGYFRGHLADVRLYSGALSGEEVAAQYKAEVTQRFAAFVEECKPITGGSRIAADGLQVRVGRSGAVQVARGEGFCVAESAYSCPGDKLGWNRLSERQAEAETGWATKPERLDARTIRVTARGAHYGLERVVRIDKGRVEVQDTLGNASQEPVGILVQHHLLTPHLLTNARLGYGSADPIVFASQPECDLGLVAEDDVSRAQLAPFASANRAGFRLDHFALAPGAKHTLRWAVYVLAPTGDALALVNAVRRDWGSNHTVLGPGSFFDANDPIIGDPARLKAYLTRRKLRVAMLSPWLDYDPGSMNRVLTRAEYKALMQRAAAAIKGADSEVKCIGSIETDWVTIDPAAIPGGEGLPVDGPGGHGPTWVTPEQTRILDAAALPWRDSLKRDIDGRVILELYSRGGKPQTALGVYPRVGNYQAQFLIEQARFLIEDVGLDGFYIDEFAPYWVKSYDRWDGFTVDIDRATGAVVRQYTDAALAGAAFRKQLCEYALSKNAAMVANTFGTTCAENALSVMRFAETWSNFDVLSLPRTGKPPFNQYIASGQFGTPIGLGVLAPSRGTNSAELLMRGLILYLRHGVLYYHYFYGDIPQTGEGSGEYGPINHMFPITPIELFEGGIIGRERIISCVSQDFAWRGPAEPTILIFGPDGRQVEGGGSRITKSADGWDVKLVLRDWEQIGVVE
ncbi:MAG: hypothetical protein FJX75_19505, partial [Armatimonadetes bacterium]|nr:hypothetical protein [Armatimonadota bacterium]